MLQTPIQSDDPTPAQKRVVDWINKELPNEHCQNLKDLRNGVSFCRVMHKYWPGALSRSQILDPSENPSEYRHNFEVLERAFAKINMPFMVTLEKLVEGDPRELHHMAQCIIRTLLITEL